MGDQEALHATNVRAYCEYSEQEERRQDKIEESEFNKVMAKVQCEKRQARTQRDADEKAKHVNHITNSERMTESCDYKTGENGRLVRTEYRRLSVDEEQDVHNTNAQLVLQKKMQAKAEREEEARNARDVGLGVSVQHSLEAMKQSRIKERTMQMVKENQEAAEAKRKSDARERLANKAFEVM